MIEYFNWPSKLIGQRNMKDCLNCCLEYITGTPYDEIPKFYEDDKTFYEKYDKWLKSKGLRRVWIECARDEEGNIHFPCVPVGSGKLMYIMEFKKPEAKHSHATVVEIQDGEIKLSDPANWELDYDSDDVTGFELLVKI